MSGIICVEEEEDDDDDDKEEEKEDDVVVVEYQCCWNEPLTSSFPVALVCLGTAPA